MCIKLAKNVSFAVLVLSVFITYIRNKPLEDLLEIESCPACFGMSLCNNFSRNEFSPKHYETFYKLVTYTANFFGKSSVIFASSKDMDVVIKKLGRNKEVSKIEKRIATVNKNSSNSVKNVVEQMIAYVDIPLGVDTLYHNFRLCPTANNFNLLYEAFNIIEGDIERTVNFWFTLLANPEPIIMKTLSEEEGWPVPKYLGSCGRAVVFENSGDMLSDRLQDPWHVRADIARQLLRAAFNFTFSHPTFAFYLTDVSPDNIAISSEGKASFIDIDHILIVDKQAKGDLPKSWNKIHSSGVDCDHCFGYSPDELCEYRISDHNVYAVCREILSPHSYLIDGGLFHSPPESFLNSHPQFWRVILNCVEPVEQNRFYYAKQIMKILNKFLSA